MSGTSPPAGTYLRQLKALRIRRLDALASERPLDDSASERPLDDFAKPGFGNRSSLYLLGADRAQYPKLRRGLAVG